MVIYRVANYQDRENEKQLHLNLDLIDEVQMDVERRVARYKYLMKKNHDAMVKPRQFNIGDLILKRASLSTMYPTHRKVGPNWKGPYKVINFKRRGTYYLVALDGHMLEHPWNMEHLRKYY